MTDEKIVPIVEQKAINNNEALREQIMQSFNYHNSQLILFIKGLDSIDAILKQHCFLNLDQAAYWARQAISVMPLNPIQNVVGDENDGKVNNEEKK